MTKKRFTLTVLLLAILLPDCLTQTYAQNAVFAWASKMGGTGGEDAKDITTDASGNVYTTGTFQGLADFDPGSGLANLFSAGPANAFVSKLGPSGNYLWALQLGGVNQTYGESIGTDGAGNVYVTGYFTGTADFDPGIGVHNLTSNGGNDIFIVKLNVTGGLVWAKSIGGTLADAAYGIAVDLSGSVYTTGNFRGTVDFDPGTGVTSLTSTGTQSIFISKLDGSGNLVWAGCLKGSSSLGISKDIAIDATGNVYTTGSFSNTIDFDPGTGISNLTTNGNRDIFISKLDASGNFVWAKNIGSTSAEEGLDITVDTANGMIYTTGRFLGTVDFDPGIGVSNLVTSAYGSAFLSKLDVSGNFVWAKCIGGTSTNELSLGSGISTDASGNVYVCGIFQAGPVDFDPGTGTFYLSPNALSGIDNFITKLDASGSFIWAKNYGTGADNNSGPSITVDNAANIYTSGRFGGVEDFDPGPDTFLLTPDSFFFDTYYLYSQDVFVQKMAPCQNTASTLTQNACDSFILDGQTYTTSGTYALTFPNAAGCDSILTLDLTINHATSGTLIQTACDSFLLEGQVYNASGTYTQVLTNAAGCDSILTLELTINNATSSMLNETACNSYTLNGTTFTATGTYLQTMTNAAGCDSNITLNLTLMSPDVTLTKNGATLTVAATANYQWVDCDNSYSAIQGATGQSYTVTENGSYAVIVTLIDGCSDTSECIAITDITGIRATSADHIFSIYPNPASDKIVLSAGFPFHDASLRLVNAIGQVIAEREKINVNTYTLDFSGYAPGVYYIEVATAGKRGRVKFVKE